MGDVFRARAVGLNVSLSNGGIDVLGDVMALAGSAVARTVWQQNLVLHFCDLERYGRGFDGFNLDDLPWTQDWRQEQDFFTEVVARATRRTGWDRLHYSPSFDYALDAFTRMLTTFRATPTTDTYLGDWTLAPRAYRLDLCIRHGIFQGECQCRLCDTSIQPIDAPTVWELASVRTSDGEVIGRAVQQIPDEQAARIRDVAGVSESDRAQTKIGPSELDQISTIVGRPLDPTASHWLYKAIA